MINNSNEMGYFKIGTFVLVGLGLMIFALLVFGSSKLFQSVIYVETYFEESIQGISAGAPVKFRGLQIGYVKEIAFTSEIYKNHKNLGGKIHNRSIYVRIAITSKLFTQLKGDAVIELLSQEVAHGLRVRLVTKGLTGTNYLEFDYVDPKSNPSPVITWRPKDFFVPSVTSTLARLSENAQYIMNELKDVDFKKLFNDVDTLTVSLSRVATATEKSFNHIDNFLETALQDFKVIANNLRILSEQLKLNPSSIIFGKPPPPLNPSKL